jgi:hypothetical protein
MECEVRVDLYIQLVTRTRNPAHSCPRKLFQVVEVNHPDTGVNVANLFLGLVKHFHIRNDVLTEKGLIDIEKFKPVSRCGDITYATVGKAFRIPSGKWSDDLRRTYEELERNTM